MTHNLHNPRGGEPKAGDAQAPFDALKTMVEAWCGRFIVAGLLRICEDGGDLVILARKDDTSMDLKARRDMHIYLAAAPQRKRGAYLARLYVPEMPGASILIPRPAEKAEARLWTYVVKAEGGKTTMPQGVFDNRWAFVSTDPAGEYPFTEAAFSRILSEWLVAYFAMKSAYYYA